MLKFFKTKIWFTNLFLSVTTLAALVMLIVTPVCRLDPGYEAMWSAILVGSIGFYRNENSTILKTMVEKYSKDNDIDAEKIYEENKEA